MDRDPSIHVTKTQFLKILDLLGVDNFPIDQTFQLARKMGLYSRAVVTSNKKDTKQVNRITLANTADANMIADLIYATRVKLRHRGIRKITELNNREWNQCKNLADICSTFASDFEMDIREAIIEYINIGVKKMDGSYRAFVARLVSMSESIVQTKIALDELSRIPRSIKDIAEKLQDLYTQKLLSSTGIRIDLSDPDKLIDFVKAAKIVTTNKFNASDYIEAQFDALSFCNGIPPTSTLGSEKGIERYMKYVYQSGSSNEEPETPEIAGSLWDQVQ